MRVVVLTSVPVAVLSIMDCSSFGLPTSPNGHHHQSGQQAANSIRVSLPNFGLSGGGAGGAGGGNGNGSGKSYNQTTTPVKCEFCNYETTHRANMYRHK